MKIGLVSFHSFANPGGVKRHIMGLFQEFRKKGVEAKIIVPRRKTTENYGKNVFLLGTSFPINFGGSQADFNINFNPLALEDVLKKEKFDVLHFHNFGFPSALQILLSPSADNALKILTFHSNVEGSKFIQNFPTFLYTLDKICQWKIDGVIGVAPLILEFFKEYKGPKRVIPNGIDLERFNTKVPEIKKFCDDKINLLFVGRMEERKGLIYLLKALKILQKEFSNLRLIIVGSGPLEEECREYVEKNKLQNVVFVGQVEGNVASYYRTADIFASPAIFGESFGLVLLEAMACGAPVVAFANKGYEQLLRNKACGKFLTKPKNFRQLAKNLSRLIGDKALRQKIAQRGLAEVREYSWEKVADRVLSFYETCRKSKS